LEPENEHLFGRILDYRCASYTYCMHVLERQIYENSKWCTAGVENNNTGGKNGV
jgi:hypothetical protein